MDQIKTPAATYTPPATAILHHTQASFTDRELPQPVHLVQYDDTVPILAVELSANGQPYSVPAGAALNISMDKRDGHYIYNPALGLNEARTIAYIAVTQQMTTGAGDFSPVLEVVVDGGVAGTAALSIWIDKNPVPEDAIESTDEYKTVQQLVQDAKASADAAAASEAAAQASQNAAASSASAAAESQTTAAANQAAAADSATSAQASAQAADASESAAANSETAAAASAASAASSATAAQEAAEQAQKVSQGALGYYETPDALRAAHPTAEAGNWAIVGSTDTLWVWDVEGAQWLDSGQNVNLSDYYTKGQVDTLVDAANSAAAAAQSTAEVAGTAAAAARTAADAAGTAAAAAQSTADTAVTDAGAAQTAAVSANANANTRMPVAGGTFTGNVAAYATNRNADCLRNAYVVNASGTGVSTNRLTFYRK